MTTKFLFFPFTHITRKQMDCLTAFFPTIEYLSTDPDIKSRPEFKVLDEKGAICPVIMSRDELDRVDQKVNEYMAWVQIHKGNEHNLKLLFRDNPYFVSDSDVTAITSHLKGAKSGQVPVEKKQDAFLQELLFLKVAQRCDEQNEGVDLELERIEKSREEMVKALRGIDASVGDILPEENPQNTDTGGIMTEKRISSWAGCMARKGALEAGNQPILVTTSRAVFNYLESNSKDVINALDIDQIKVHENGCEFKSDWQNQFTDKLICAVKEGCNPAENFPAQEDGCSLSGQIKLSFFSGDEINRLFNLSDKQVAVCLVNLKKQNT